MQIIEYKVQLKLKTYANGSENSTLFVKIFNNVESNDYGIKNNFYLVTKKTA